MAPLRDIDEEEVPYPPESDPCRCVTLAAPLRTPVAAMSRADFAVAVA